MEIKPVKVCKLCSTYGWRTLWFAQDLTVFSPRYVNPCRFSGGLAFSSVPDVLTQIRLGFRSLSNYSAMLPHEWVAIFRPTEWQLNGLISWAWLKLVNLQKLKISAAFLWYLYIFSCMPLQQVSFFDRQRILFFSRKKNIYFRSSSDKKRSIFLNKIYQHICKNNTFYL